MKTVSEMEEKNETEESESNDQDNKK